MPVSIRVTGLAETLLMVLGLLLSINETYPWSLVFVSICSTNEFQLPHSGHFPSQDDVT